MFIYPVSGRMDLLCGSEDGGETPAERNSQSFKKGREVAVFSCFYFNA